jgi:hypothetical protein
MRTEQRFFFEHNTFNPPSKKINRGKRFRNTDAADCADFHGSSYPRHPHNPCAIHDFFRVVATPFLIPSAASIFSRLHFVTDSLPSFFRRSFVPVFLCSLIVRLLNQHLNNIYYREIPCFRYLIIYSADFVIFKFSKEFSVIFCPPPMLLCSKP